MTSVVRRVVTGVLPSGRSGLASDSVVPTAPATPSVLTGEVAQIWSGDGVSFRVFTVSGSSASVPVMPHRTATRDFVVVLAGEVLLELDDAVVRLRAGDTLVQDGTSHAWRCGSAEPATVAVVLVDRPRHD